jgi:NADPH:quinone reductase-like Zn-dependent oxidoreductase
MRVGLMAGRLDYSSMGTYRTAGVYRQSALLPLPDDFTAAEGAAFWVAALTAVAGMAVGGLTTASAQGKRVLVTAASSGVGVVALQTARGMGAETIASTTSADKAEDLAALADHVVVARDPQAMVDAVQQTTGGSGVDLAFDPIGFAYAQALMQTAAAGGQVVFYGILAGTEAPLDLRSLILKDLAVHGFTVYRLQRDLKMLEQVVETALDLATRGSIRPLIADEFPFEKAPRALSEMARNRHLGKIVLSLE